ncbi:hypothetical protein [Chitinophaga sp. XS-30]|uniref:hypothetical protein n=1 Tax=Chitinophaga sp. XS-30 TaxID=2604421 RepID=UPI0011DE4091|nr:hypothetical protein FW415_02115 [Chitinophaga sp. XS-30]
MRMNNPVHYQKWILLFASLTYLITACFSTGYFHPDEHFQLLEFANFKMGNISGYELPWEYATEIRPTFQPWFAYLVMKSCTALKNKQSLHHNIHIKNVHCNTGNIIHP